MIDAFTLLEARITVERQLGSTGLADLDLLLSRAAITAVPPAELQVLWALQGWRRCGKGRQRAGLNLGDGFSQGLPRTLNAPLLFPGTHFSKAPTSPPRTYRRRCLPKIPANACPPRPP